MTGKTNGVGYYLRYKIGEEEKETMKHFMCPMKKITTKNNNKMYKNARRKKRIVVDGILNGDNVATNNNGERMKEWMKKREREERECDDFVEEK